MHTAQVPCHQQLDELSWSAQPTSSQLISAISGQSFVDMSKLWVSLACLHPASVCRPRVRGRFIRAAANSPSDPPPQGAEASSNVLTAAVQEVLLPGAAPQ